MSNFSFEGHTLKCAALDSVKIPRKPLDLWFTEAWSNWKCCQCSSYISTAHMLFKNNPPVAPRGDRLQPRLMFSLLYLFISLLFTGHNMCCIALTFTTVNVVSLKTPLKRAHPRQRAEGEREISRGDKSEVWAGGQRCQALSKGALPFVR